MDTIITEDPRGYLVLVDYSVTVLAIIANCLVLDGLINFNRNTSADQSAGHVGNNGGGGYFHVFGYRRFFVSLIASDIYLCIVNVLAIAYTIYAKYQGRYLEMCIPVKMRSMYHVAFVANLLSLIAMSADHLIGIVWPSVYKQLMKNRVVICIVSAIWVGSISFGLSDYWNAIAIYLKIKFNEVEATKNLSHLRADYLQAARAQFTTISSPSSINSSNFTTNFILSNNYSSIQVIQVDENAAMERWQSFAFCLLYTVSQPWLVEALLILTVVCFFFLIFSYAIIFKTILKQIAEGNSSIQVATIIATTVLLIIAFVLCWLPMTVFEFLSNAFPYETASIFDGSEKILELCLYSIFQCYPLFDAIICTLRLRKVRRYIFHKYCRFLCVCCKNRLIVDGDNEDAPIENYGDDAGYELSEL